MEVESIQQLRSLRTPDQFKSACSIAIDWLLIVGGYFLIFESYILIPLGILLIGSRQRALSNLSHDAAHVNLFKKKSLNDLVSNLFCALPMFETVNYYRHSHNKHHLHLGDLEKDPDSAAHLKYGYNDSKPWKGNPWSNYLQLILNGQAIKASVLGSLFNLSISEKFLTALWWVSVMGLISALTTFKISFFILIFWLVAKATSYHIIRILAEFLDHSGLNNREIILSTRNLPHQGITRFIFHPNCDTYHIVHHLYPGIPHYNLAKAHKVLAVREDYKAAHHCDSYFFGRHSAVDCWVGRCGEISL